MSEDDLKNLKELESKNKPRILTMYFEDGGEASVVPYDDYEDIQQQLKQRDEMIEECIESIQNFMTHIDDGFCADMMTFIEILQKYKGDNNE